MSDSIQQNIIQFDPDRHKFDDPNLEQLFRDISRGIKEMKQKNQELEEKNSELAAALDDANARITRFEQSVPTDSEVGAAALRAAAQMLSQAEEATDLKRTAAKAENASGYEEAIRLSLDLQKEAISMLEKALSAATRRNQETDSRATEILKEARNSILAMAANPERYGSKQVRSTYPPSTSHSLHESHPSTAFHMSGIDPFDGPKDRNPLATGEVSSRPIVPANPPTQPEPIELVASPFRSFATLTAFHRAVQQLPGVVNVDALTFEEGTLRLTVEYSGSTPLAGRLAELSQFKLRFASIEGKRIEVVLEQDHPLLKQQISN